MPMISIFHVVSNISLFSLVNNEIIFRVVSVVSNETIFNVVLKISVVNVVNVKNHFSRSLECQRSQ